jgi:hypothetical protein
MFYGTLQVCGCGGASADKFRLKNADAAQTTALPAIGADVESHQQGRENAPSLMKDAAGDAIPLPMNSSLQHTLQATIDAKCPVSYPKSQK